MTANELLDNAAPRIVPPLDPGFRPAILAHEAYRSAVKGNNDKSRAVIALESSGGAVYRHEFDIMPCCNSVDEATRLYIGKLAKFLLWSRGGWKIHFAGSAKAGKLIRAQYSADGERAFDAELMSRVYERDFEVDIVEEERIPSGKEGSVSLGGNLDGCRIGFDLGASDYKLAAVHDGKPVFTTEIPWNPKDEPDPAYHYSRIQKGLKLAAEHLPRVDAIGGSSAGVYVDNRPMVASLFRSVPRDRFESEVKPMFLRIAEEWKVPLTIINDGDVTALAGAMSLGENGMLGIAMGSSEAAGFLRKNGKIAGWLNELAFAPVDFNPEGPPDEWSGDLGVGAMYFSQQAVNRLAPAAGTGFPEEMPLPERLKLVQELADNNDKNAAAVFETIGVYLGYTIPWYAEFYDYDNLLVLGRVTSGKGGEILVEKAREVLKKEFPETAERITVHVPDEKSRRVGQAVAAASLPVTAG